MAEELVPLFVAPDTRTADQVARLLEAEGIQFEEKLDASDADGRACMLGTQFLVRPADLDRTRRILATHFIG